MVEREHAVVADHPAGESMGAAIALAGTAQKAWAGVSIEKRLVVVHAFRRSLAKQGGAMAQLMPPQLVRSVADSLSSEIIPLAEAALFLELRAERALAPKTLSKVGRPSWLKDTSVVVHREPHGVVLIIGPANYPLFLPGVQSLQALVAGNAVVWKPGAGGSRVAHKMRELLEASGLPGHLLYVSTEEVGAGEAALRCGVDKVVLTGSEQSGKAVLKQAAGQLIPATVELSGCDAFFVLPGADVQRAVNALAFGLQLNGGHTCIAPRRIFVHAQVAQEFYPLLSEALREAPIVPLTPAMAAEAASLLEDAEAKGGRTLISSDRVAPHGMRPIVILQGTTAMRVMSADVFAPIAAAMTVGSLREALEAAHACPYALGASVFGADKYAQSLAEHLRAGVVIKNDVIVPTADPRVAFGGLGRSGFGKTRGLEGLLEMTVSKSVVTQSAKRLRHLEAAHPRAQQIFESYLRLKHGRGVVGRLRAVASLCRAATAKR